METDYQFFDHTADIGAHIHGATLPELFSNAARAMYAGMGRLVKAEHRSQESGNRRRRTDDRRPMTEDRNAVTESARWAKSVRLEAPTIEDQLHDWLAELLFEFAAHHLLFDGFAFDRLDETSLVATVRGGPIDLARSQPGAEIKAITYHQLRVEQRPDGSWRATVIFDV